MEDKSSNKIINNILDGIEENWDNLKKARYIMLKLGEMYKYNSIYNYTSDEEEKNEIFNRSFSDKTNFEQSGDIQYLNLDNLNKICVDMESIYGYLLTLANVRHLSLGSDVIVFLSNDESISDSIIQSLVKDLYTIKTKKRPVGIFASNADETLKRIEQIDKELGYIDERGYVGEYIEESNEKKSNDIDVETFLNRAGNYIKNVLGAKLSNVELHKYYKYLVKTILPNKHIHIIPFVKGEDYEKVQFLIANNTEKGKNEFFLYEEEEEVFRKVELEQMQVIDGKLVGKREDGKKTLHEYLEEKFDIEK